MKEENSEKYEHQTQNICLRKTMERQKKDYEVFKAIEEENLAKDTVDKRSAW